MKKIIITFLVTLALSIGAGLGLYYYVNSQDTESAKIERSKDTTTLAVDTINPDVNPLIGYKIAGDQAIITPDGQSCLQLKTAVAENAFRTANVVDINQFYYNATKCLSTKNASEIKDLVMYQPIINEKGSKLYVRFTFDYDTEKTTEDFFYKEYGSYVGNNTESANYDLPYDLSYGKNQCEHEIDIMLDLLNAGEITTEVFNNFTRIETCYYLNYNKPGIYFFNICMPDETVIVKWIKVRDNDVVTSSLNELSEEELIMMLIDSKFIPENYKYDTIDTKYFDNWEIPGTYDVRINADPYTDFEDVKLSILVTDAYEGFDVNEYTAKLFKTYLQAIDVDLVASLDTKTGKEEKIDMCIIDGEGVNVQNEKVMLLGENITYIHSGGFAYINYIDADGKEAYVECENLWVDPVNRIERVGANYKVHVEALYTTLFDILKTVVDDPNAIETVASEQKIINVATGNYTEDSSGYHLNPILTVILSGEYTDNWIYCESNLNEKGEVKYDGTEAADGILVFYINYRNTETLVDNHFYLVYGLNTEGTTDAEIIKSIKLYKQVSGENELVFTCVGEAITWNDGYSIESLNLGDCRTYEANTYRTLNAGDVLSNLVEVGETDYPEYIFNQFMI